MKIVQTFIALICLIIIAGVATDYFNLEYRANKASPIKEIEIVLRKPMSTLDMLIAQCPNEFGKLKDFLDCREEIVLRYSE